MQMGFQLKAKDGSAAGRPIPASFAPLFAKAQIELPAAGKKLSLAEVDEAIKNLSLDDRMNIKSGLQQAGLIG